MAAFLPMDTQSYARAAHEAIASPAELRAKSANPS
jgi:hypothetical protein